MELYRGDSLPSQMCDASRRDRGRTFADHFCGHGLSCKFADNGCSSLLEPKNLVNFVVSHVGYNRDEAEQDFADHSPLISFSADPDRAFYFTDRTERKDLRECPFDEATHFVWKLDFDLSLPSQPGLYEFTYTANSVNCRRFVEDQVRRGLARAASGDIDTIAEAMKNQIAGFYADSDNTTHVAQIIDVVTYINGQYTSRRKKELVDNALERASRASEWLLFPQEPGPKGHGFSGRFSMNRHLSAYQWFRVHR